MSRARFTNTKGSSRKRTCENKKKFPTHAAAHYAMCIFKERKGGIGTMQVYACKICGGFHWGHAKGSIIDRSQRLRNLIDKAIEKDAKKGKTSCQTV